MADYIERDKVLEAILDLPPKMDEQGYGWLARGGLYQLIRDFKSADVAPVVHGRWKWSEGGQCSECGFHNSNFGYNYCPNCGAKMDGEK